MLPELHIPVFSRLDEYLSCWAMEPRAFVALWQAIGRMDLAAHMAEEAPPLKSQTEMVAAKGGKNVAVIPVLGTLMKQRSSMGGTSTIQLRRDIRQATADPNVSAILLAVESPGGVVAGTADLAADVKAAADRKPVYAHIDDLTASAAYWIASQADQIFANNRTALVGSIGTILTVYDQSAAAEREGIKPLVFATGPLKGAGVPGAPVTPEQAAYFQGIVNAGQAEFDAAVKKGRGLTSQQLADVRTGGVFSAPEALSRGLIDGIQPLGKTIDMLAAAASQPKQGRGTRAGLPTLSLGGLPTIKG